MPRTWIVNRWQCKLLSCCLTRWKNVVCIISVNQLGQLFPHIRKEQRFLHCRMVKGNLNRLWRMNMASLSANTRANYKRELQAMLIYYLSMNFVGMTIVITALLPWTTCAYHSGLENQVNPNPVHLLFPMLMFLQQGADLLQWMILKVQIGLPHFQYILCIPLTPPCLIPPSSPMSRMVNPLLLLFSSQGSSTCAWQVFSLSSAFTIYWMASSFMLFVKIYYNSLLQWFPFFQSSKNLLYHLFPYFHVNVHCRFLPGCQLLLNCNFPNWFYLNRWAIWSKQYLVINSI